MPINDSACEIHPAIRGVFGYLEASLPRADLDELSTTDVGIGMASLTSTSSVRGKAALRVVEEFRLMHFASPIRKALDGYKLYHKHDMADALVCAFSLFRQGKNPNDALHADYCLVWGGILSWKTYEEVREVRTSGASIWSDFLPFHREGDRFAHYSLPLETGNMLIRGDRLVWSSIELHIGAQGPSLWWLKAREKFNELGAIRGFLEGKFDWPPSGWNNPVTPEEEAEHQKKYYALEVIGDD